MGGWEEGGRAAVRSNDGMQGETDVSDTGAFYCPRQSKRCHIQIRSPFVSGFRKMIFEDIVMVSLGRDCGGPQISRITAIQTGEVLALDGIALSLAGIRFHVSLSPCRLR